MTKGTAVAQSIRIPQNRKFVRFQINNKVKFKLLSDDQLHPRTPSPRFLTGKMLNLSRGGMLILTDRELVPQQFVALNMEIPQVTEITNVLGKVKRVERDGKKYLAGIEFCELAEFYSSFSIRESAKLPINLESFRRRLADLLLRRRLATLH
jgi:hypothetical protein